MRVAPTRERGITEYFCATSRDEAEDRFVYLEEVEVDGRNTVPPREHGSNHIVGDQSQLYQVITQPASVVALVVLTLRVRAGH